MAGRTVAGLLVAAVLLASAALSAPGASAALPEEDPWGGPKCTTGTGAGQCRNPRGVAADPRNGHVFISDQANNRVVELNARGQFIKAWGWGVDTGAAELQTCTEESSCQAAPGGANAGQLSAPLGIALDSAGDVYVVDFSNRRVQKYDRGGSFVWMIGGEVNETSGGNVCPRPGFPADTCKAAPAARGGGEDGEFGTWQVRSFIAVDANGTETVADDSVYVGDQNRIQAFDTDGTYQDQCATPGTVQALAVDSGGSLYLQYTGDAKVRKMTPPPGCELLEAPAFELKIGDGRVEPTAVAVDRAGDVYAFGPPVHESTQQAPIFRFSPEGGLIERFGKGQFNAASNGLATNLCPGSPAPGNLYVANLSLTTAFVRAYGTEPIGCFKASTGAATNVTEFSARLNGTVDPDGGPVSGCRFEYGTSAGYGTTIPCAESPAEIGEGTDPVPVHADVAGLEKGTVYHFRLRATVGGEDEAGADGTFKTLGPPVISDEHLVSATETQATVRALVNPEGFAATYRFQYATLAAFEAAGFAGAPSTPPVPLGADRSDHGASAVISGLSPGTSYRWRIVAANSSGTTEGAPRGLDTYRPFAAPGPCPNEALRAGAAAILPDCRAYEMVSPVDKNGGDVVSQLSSLADPGGYMQARPDGDAIAYTALTAFAGAPASVLFNQYLANRGAGGWSTAGIHPPVNGAKAPGDTHQAIGFNREFMAFTPDLCQAWLIDYQAPGLTDDAQPDRRNLYRRENCGAGAGALEALTAPPPVLPGSADILYVTDKSLGGVSEDGAHAVFIAGAKLTENAAESTATQVYERSGGENHLVSVRNDGTAATGSIVGSGWNRYLEGAVSDDARRVYWTEGLSGGDVFIRENPTQAQSALDGGGKCSEPAKACTRAVSGVFDGFFWGASPDGSRALYSEGEGLVVYDLEADKAGQPARRTIAAVAGGQVRGVVGQSEDMSHVYFVSEKDLGLGPNDQEEEAIEGEPNLYLDEEGAKSFVATLSEQDLGLFEPGTNVAPYQLASSTTYSRPTRVSADGTLAFQSRAPLTGFDNTLAGGKAAVEVYRYGPGAGELTCVSCNPSGARPQTRDMGEPYSSAFATLPTKVPAAAWIPTLEHPLHASSVISSDGRRLFFNSNDALVPHDTNGAPDVYEWEAAGKGSCSVVDPSYFPQNDGCLYLISSGESPHGSEFWEASPDGEDVFFTTASSLVPPDPGLVDLYDARAGGGYEYPGPPTECEGEACQSPPPPPQLPTPASATYRGPANAAPRRSKPRCPKGKRRVRRAGKVRCVPKRKGQGRQRSRARSRGRAAG